MSELALGTWRFGRDSDEADTFAQLDLFRDRGGNFVDAADVYGDGLAEEIVGRWLASRGGRDELVVATKVWGRTGPGPNALGLSRKHILSAIDASLRRLQTDHVDVYYVHRWDYTTPIEETMEALDAVVRAGKARYLGASSMYAWQFATAQHVAEKNGWHRFVAMQNHYHLAYREEEREMVPLCLDQGVGVLPYSPLARGLLTGTRAPGGGGSTTRSGNDPAAQQLYSDADFGVVDALLEVARDLGRPPAQVALAWLHDRPGVTAPIVGVTQERHLEDALASVDLELGAEECARLEAPYLPHPVAGPE